MLATKQCRFDQYSSEARASNTYNPGFNNPLNNSPMHLLPYSRNGQGLIPSHQSASLNDNNCDQGGSIGSLSNVRFNPCDTRCSNNNNNNNSTNMHGITGSSGSQNNDRSEQVNIISDENAFNNQNLGLGPKQSKTPRTNYHPNIHNSNNSSFNFHHNQHYSHSEDARFYAESDIDDHPHSTFKSEVIFMIHQSNSLVSCLLNFHFRDISTLWIHLCYFSIQLVTE